MNKTVAPHRASLPSYQPGPQSLDLFHQEQKLIAPGLQSVALLSQIVLDHGRGCIVTDVDGKEYIDLMAGIGVASLGHAHPEYVRILKEQMEEITTGSFTTRNRLKFLKLLAQVTPGLLKRCQMYSSGAEAVEAALRLAKSYTRKYEFIAFWGGFHGKTGGVLGLLGDEFKHEMGPLMPGSYLAPYPDPYRCPLGDPKEHDCAAHCLDFLRRMIRRATTRRLAAIVVEPIQGTAGNVIPPPGFLKGLKEIAVENEALLIADEMLTGFGRTGRWFGFEHEEILPDILTIGKGMAGGFPVSGIISTEEITSAKPFSNPSGSSSSYGGNPLAAAACYATLKALCEENLPENAGRVGEKMLKRLRLWELKFPFIGCVRGRGLMLGIELVKDRQTREPLPREICRFLFEESLRRGLLAMCYTTPIRINPPLNIDAHLAEQGLDRLEEALSATAKRYRLC